jgi:hypothetical protein
MLISFIFINLDNLSNSFLSKYEDKAPISFFALLFAGIIVLINEIKPIILDKSLFFINLVVFLIKLVSFFNNINKV